VQSVNDKSGVFLSGSGAQVLWARNALIREVKHVLKGGGTVKGKQGVKTIVESGSRKGASSRTPRLRLCIERGGGGGGRNLGSESTRLLFRPSGSKGKKDFLITSTRRLTRRGGSLLGGKNSDEEKRREMMRGPLFFGLLRKKRPGGQKRVDACLGSGLEANQVMI